MINCDTSKIEKLCNDASVIQKEIENYNTQLEDIYKNIKSMLAKGYWYTCDIDLYWKKPKKYSIKNIYIKDNKVDITVKEVFKKKPWSSFTGETYVPLNTFLNLNIYKTEEEAMDAYLHRICPKCGGFMLNSDLPWCGQCMKKREVARKEFDSTHRFYDPKRRHFYNVEYDDELVRDRGYGGAKFVIRRIDTNELIMTSNLWGCGFGDNVNNLPEIEFVEGSEKL